MKRQNEPVSLVAATYLTKKAITSDLAPMYYPISHCFIRLLKYLKEVVLKHYQKICFPTLDSVTDLHLTKFYRLYQFIKFILLNFIDYTNMILQLTIWPLQTL